MPLEQQTFWFRWYDAAIAPGTTDIDIPLPHGRNIAIEGWGGYREDATLIFQLGVVFFGGEFKILVPSQSLDTAGANNHWITLTQPVTYTDYFNEIPMSTWKGCDVEYIRIRVNNAAAGNKYAVGHVRGVYYG